MNIIPSQMIPKGGDCPLDDTAFLYNLGVSLQEVCEREEGIGLSAVQVGLPYNFFVIKFDEKYRYFVNCVYEAIDAKKEKSVEGCLSLKDSNGNLKYYEVERFTNIRISGKEVLASEIVDLSETPANIYRIVFQHEIDHQNQVLISDIGRRVYLRKER